jgi:hypothetical protein
MNKITNKEQDSQISDDSDILTEYDFTQGIRGKYYQRYPKNNLHSLPSINFITDNQGKKTAGILDLKKHNSLWEGILAKSGDSQEFKFISNDSGEKIAVLIEFKKHGEIWENVYDSLIGELAGYEPQSSAMPRLGEAIA